MNLKLQTTVENVIFGTKTSTGGFFIIKMEKTTHVTRNGCGKIYSTMESMSVVI